jgi:hypothetical protein
MGDLAFLPPDREASEHTSRASSGQHEEHTELRSPAREVVSKNSTEPQAAHY